MSFCTESNFIIIEVIKNDIMKIYKYSHTYIKIQQQIPSSNVVLVKKAHICAKSADL